MEKCMSTLLLVPRLYEGTIQAMYSLRLVRQVLCVLGRSAFKLECLNVRLSAAPARRDSEYCSPRHHFQLRHKQASIEDMQKMCNVHRKVPASAHRRGALACFNHLSASIILRDINSYRGTSTPSAKNALIGSWCTTIDARRISRSLTTDTDGIKEGQWGSSFPRKFFWLVRLILFFTWFTVLEFIKLSIYHH